MTTFNKLILIALFAISLTIAVISNSAQAVEAADGYSEIYPDIPNARLYLETKYCQKVFKELGHPRASTLMEAYAMEIIKADSVLFSYLSKVVKGSRSAIMKPFRSELKPIAEIFPTFVPTKRDKNSYLLGRFNCIYKLTVYIAFQMANKQQASK